MSLLAKSTSTSLWSWLPMWEGHTTSHFTRGWVESCHWGAFFTSRFSLLNLISASRSISKKRVNHQRVVERYKRSNEEYYQHYQNSPTGSWGMRHRACCLWQSMAGVWPSVCATCRVSGCTAACGRGGISPGPVSTQPHPRLRAPDREHIPQQTDLLPSESFQIYSSEHPMSACPWIDSCWNDKLCGSLLHFYFIKEFLNTDTFHSCFCSTALVLARNRSYSGPAPAELWNREIETKLKAIAFLTYFRDPINFQHLLNEFW